MKRIMVLCALVILSVNMFSCLNRNSKAERAKNTQEGVHQQILDSKEQEDKWKGEGVRKIADTTKQELDSVKRDSIERTGLKEKTPN